MRLNAREGRGSFGYGSIGGEQGAAMPGWDPFDSRPDRVGGRYLLGDVLGEGGSGCVFRATDEKTGAAVAVKVVEAPALHRPLRFLAEARDMARLKHPRVVRVLDAGNDGQWYFAVMELMPGGSLKDLVTRDGPLPAAKALELEYQLLQGLHAVHGASLVHRDVKPHNIVLDERGCVKLTDFGLARHAPGDVPWRTRTGEALGSPTYRAPEQERTPGAAGREADIYGAGGLLWFLLTGERPRAFYMLNDEEYGQYTSRLPAEVAAIIRKAMAFRPEDRYRTAHEMAGAVSRAYDTLPERQGTPPMAVRWMRTFDDPDRSKPLWSRLRSALGW